MAYAYLTEENVFDTYRKSVAYMKPYLDLVDEQERIARNQPHPGIDKAYPKVTDGTTSSIIQKTPRRIIQQLPTGVIKGEGWLPIVAGFIYKDTIIPNANEDQALLQKCWMMTSRAMAHGASHSYCPFVSRGDYLGTDMTVPYIKNIKFEAGKVSDLASKCQFMEAFYQTSDIEGIIAEQKRLKKEDPSFEATWDIKALEEVKTLITQKTDEESSKNEGKADDTNKSGVKLIHAFQTGKNAKFFTFHFSSQTIVRTKVNKDPRGLIPLDTMYFETDGISPLGRGIVEQVGSLQNLMDSEMQMYQYNRALMLNPPVIKRGTYSKTQVKFQPNVIIDLGSDPNSSLEAMKIDTTAIANFPQNYGLMKSQLLNLTASPDTSISAEVGNPGFSKTPAGVNAQQANVSVDDNYIRKQFETWFERWSETAINLYFAEQSGIQEIQLDKDTAMKLRKLEQTGELEQGFVSDDNKIMLDFDSATEALKFEVDASTSNMKNDAMQLEALDGLLARLEKSTVLQGIIPPKKIVGAWNSIVQASGVENPEELAVSEEELAEQEQQQQMMAQQQMEQEAALMQQGTQVLPPQTEMPPEDTLAPMPPQEPQMGEDDLAFVTALQDMGYSDEKIQQALAMDQMGYSNEDIIQILEATTHG